MTNRNRLLGRPRPSEKLSREEIAALDRMGVTPETPPTTTREPAKPPSAKGNGIQRKINKKLLKFHWTTECPDCGFKVGGIGQPQRGQRLAKCGRCKAVLFLE